MSELEKQVEDAFQYRGDVTVNLKEGGPLVGFLANRDFKPHASLKKAPFVELFLPDGRRQEILLSAIDSVELSGVDHAAT